MHTSIGFFNALHKKSASFDTNDKWLVPLNIDLLGSNAVTCKLMAFSLLLTLKLTSNYVMQSLKIGKPSRPSGLCFSSN